MPSSSSSALETENAPLNVAVVGFGKLGLLHAGIFSGLPNTRLAAICEPSSLVRSVLSAQVQGVTVHENHRPLLDNAGLHAAVIAAPTYEHVSVAEDFVRAGIPVLVEKPLSPRAQDADALAAVARDKGVVVAVGYMTRFLRTFARARELLQAGAIGKVLTFRATMYVGQLFSQGKGWRYDPEKSGGGVMITQNSHLVDLLVWYFGELATANGFTRKFYSKDTEDYVHSYLSFTNGVTGFFDASWSYRHHRTPIISIHVEGVDGTLDVDDDSLRVYTERTDAEVGTGWHTFTNPELDTGCTFDIGGPQYTAQAEDFVSAIRGGTLVGSSLGEAQYVQGVIDTIYESARQGGAPCRCDIPFAG